MMKECQRVTLEEEDMEEKKDEDEEQLRRRRRTSWIQDNPEDDLNDKSFINYMITYLKWLNNLKKVMLEPLDQKIGGSSVKEEGSRD